MMHRLLSNKWIIVSLVVESRTALLRPPRLFSTSVDSDRSLVRLTAVASEILPHLRAS